MKQLRSPLTVDIDDKNEVLMQRRGNSFFALKSVGRLYYFCLFVPFDHCCHFSRSAVKVPHFYHTNIHTDQMEYLIFKCDWFRFEVSWWHVLLLCWYSFTFVVIFNANSKDIDNRYGFNDKQYSVICIIRY